MYKSIYYDKKEEVVHILDDTKGYICKKYKDFAFRKKVGGSYKSLWGDECEKTIYFNANDYDTFEADLPCETKILIDLYQNEDDPAKNNSIVLFDIETDATGGYPNVDLADKEITAITLYDNTCKKYHTLVVDKQNQVKNVESATDSLKAFQTEADLLSYFLNLWEQISPTIISAWNGDGFDFPYVAKRIAVVLGESDMERLSPIGVVYYNKRKEKMVIGCVNCIDYMVLYKKFRFDPKPQYSLNYIGNVELGKGKVQYQGSLNDLYKTDIQKYIEYNKFDVELLRLLDEKFKFIDLAIGICSVGHVPYEWFNMSSRFIEGAIIVYMRRNGNLVAPNKSHENVDKEENDDDEDDDDDHSFTGAYVKEPVPGLYEWVVSVDVNSLYPNTIRTINISPECYVGTISNWDVEKYVKNEITEFKLGNTTYSINEIKELFTGKVCIAANGAIFDNKVRGIVPCVIDKWINNRTEYKTLAKKYSKEGNNELSEFYDRRQHIEKIFLNSVFGILGLAGGRFYKKEYAEAITISGQNIIKTTYKIIESYFNDKYRQYNKQYDKDDVIKYGDTDSAHFSLLPLIELENVKDCKEYSIKTVKEIVNKINGTYPIMSKRFFNSDNNTIKIVGESLCDTAFFVAKKKYALHVVYNIDDDRCVDKVKVKGIEFIKSSFPIKFSKFGNELISSILKKKPKEEIDKDILDFVSNLKNLSALDVAKNTSVKLTGKNGDKITNFDPKDRTPFSFVKGTTGQGKAALSYNDCLKTFGFTKKVEPVYSGGKIKWVYLRNNQYNLESLAWKADGTDPKEIMDIIEMYVDRTGLYKHELKKKLEAFYAALKWEFPSQDAKKSAKFFD